MISRGWLSAGLILSPLVLSAQANDQFTFRLNNDASLTVSLAGTLPKTYRIEPRFIVMQRADNPKLSYQDGRKFDNALGTLKLPGWTKPNTTDLTLDFFQAAPPLVIRAQSARQTGDEIVWTFPAHASFQLTASLTLPTGAGEPIVRYRLTPQTAGYYSVGFAGMPELTPAQADAIWQPWVWQEKRFPPQSFLSVEEMCGLPAAMVEKDGVTYGVVADPDQIPFRLPSMQLDKLAFGVLLRNQTGGAQPQFFAPVLGSGASKLNAGQPGGGQCRLLFYRGNQLAAFQYVAQRIFGFKDYRKNVFTNLNQTLENFVDYAMNDVYSGWNPDLRGFDYSTDVAQTVKVVSGMHPLSVALLTDNESIYQRRALPMIEFNLSREKYLFTIQKDVKRQNASSRMAGPCLEVAELATLNTFFRDRTPLFRYLADSLRHTTRELNLRIPSHGDSWPNLLGLYRMNHDPAVLQVVKQKADAYIQSRVNTPQTDFRDANVPGAGQFWSDFAPLWSELLDLYEETGGPAGGDQRYLEAAAVGAKRYAQYCWFSPRIPDSTVTINPDGIVGYRSYEGVRDQMPLMTAGAQTVPAWRVSQIGLTPEACNTFASNPAIFLTHYAPFLLRLAHYTNDDFLRSVARSAVVGRYTNYPGYDINGIFNTVYERPDYPLRPLNEISYNQVYYNHVWPQIALLFDYLITDVFAQSNGAIRFPHEFVQGYAYLKSNVYGHQPGEFYGDQNVNLWLPKQVLTLDNEQINYLTGYGNGNFYVALTNQGTEVVEVTVRLNPNVVPVDVARAYPVRGWQQNSPVPAALLTNGILKVRVAPKGITALAIDGLAVKTQFQEKVFQATGRQSAGRHSASRHGGQHAATSDGKSFRITHSPFGKVSATTLSFGRGLTSAYIWLEANADQLKKATLFYRPAGTEPWQQVADRSYPFEFSIPMAEATTGLEWRVEGTTGEDGGLRSVAGVLKGIQIAK
ncbi:MAG: hypothetical protein H7Z75_17135 [Ferruginibacter sp.]|nr:hypothetical protein [Cytophagales bacterium]